MEANRTCCHDGRNHTPLPTGRYVVGCTDIMTPPKSPSKFGSFVRIYYPAEGDDILNYTSQWPLWMPDAMYLEGYSDFLNMRLSIFKMLYNVATGGQIYIPAILNGQVHRKLTKCPVVVFSHGLGGLRTAYSTICTELASYGFVVASVEHRHGSACISYTLEDADQTIRRDQEPLRSTDDLSNSTKEDSVSNSVDIRDTMDSTKIFPRSLCQKWIRYQRVGKNDSSYQLRNDQVHTRAEECVLALALLESLNKGEFVDNLLNSGLSLQTTFTNLMDISNAAIIGHSFGGATVLRTLCVEKHAFKVGIALDVYMFPVEKEVELLKAINQPLLFINSEKFKPERNAETMKIMEQTEAERTFVTIKGTVHQNQVDTPFITGHLSRRFFGASSSLDRFVAMAVNNSLMFKFLWKHLNLKEDDKVIEYAQKSEEHLLHGIQL